MLGDFRRSRKRSALFRDFSVISVIGKLSSNTDFIRKYTSSYGMFYPKVKSIIVVQCTWKSFKEVICHGKRHSENEIILLLDAITHLHCSVYMYIHVCPVSMLIHVQAIRNPWETTDIAQMSNAECCCLLDAISFELVCLIHSKTGANYFVSDTF